MEEFQKQETIENIKARVEALKKNAKPPTYTPGNQEAGSTVKIGETLYKVINQHGTLRREDVKEPSKIRKQRDQVAYLLSLKNPNLNRRLRQEERSNKIKMFNKAQKATESEVSIVRPLHPKTLAPAPEKAVVEASETVSETLTETPKVTVKNELDTAYIEMMRINEKKRILKAKRRKANKLASQKRKHNVKHNKN